MREVLKKVCRKCEEEKFCYEFTRSKNKKDGFKNYCKECDKEARNKKPLEIQTLRKNTPQSLESW